MRPSERTLKRLFALSGNHCPFPKCTASLTYEATLVGEVCHIKGDRPGSARYDPDQSEADRQAYDNLIAMCPTHHTVIDDDEESYPVERLLRMKADHEARSTIMPDAEAQLIAENIAKNAFLNVGQSGGIAARQITAHSFVVHQSSHGPSITQKRQLEAVERLWKAVKDLRTAFASLTCCDTILTPREIDGFFRKRWPEPFSYINDYALHEATAKHYRQAKAEEVESERPFVSPRLWSIYFVIRAVYGRFGVLFQFSFEKGLYQDWHHDRGMDQLLRSVLPANVVEQLKTVEIGGLMAAMNYLEQHFLAEAGLGAN
jgi:hypothetical protein